MRDDEEFRHYAPLLRRIIILVAVITAVPVMLWTITAFVRTYVAPPRVPTFHQLASTASINGPAEAKAEAKAQLQAAMQAKATNSAPSAPATVPTPAPAPAPSAAPAADATDTAAAKGPLLSERAPNSEDAASATTRSADITTSSVTVSNTAAPSTKANDVSPPPFPGGEASNSAETASAAQTEPETTSDASPSFATLTGPIPLPRRRPREIGGMQTADMSLPARVPLPRPRPDAAGPGAQAETNGGTPLEFIQNLFH